jgi:hypothetical protein
MLGRIRFLPVVAVLALALLASGSARAANNVPSGVQCPASPHCWAGSLTMHEVIDSQLVDPGGTITNKADNITTVNVDGMGLIVEHETSTGETVLGGEVGPGTASLDIANTITNYSCGDGLGTSRGTLTGSVSGDGRVLVVPDDPDHPTLVTVSGAVDTNIPTTSTYDCNSDHQVTQGPGGGFSFQAVVQLPADWDGLHLSGSFVQHVGDYAGQHDRTITWTLTRKARPGCPATSFALVCGGDGPPAPPPGQELSNVHTLFVSGTGWGGVRSLQAGTLGGIRCRNVCSDSYPAGTVVTLVATPGPLERFAGWTGACSSWGTQPTCLVTIGSTDVNVFARFETVRGSQPLFRITPTGSHVQDVASRKFSDCVRPRLNAAGRYRQAMETGTCVVVVGRKATKRLYAMVRKRFDDVIDPASINPCDFIPLKPFAIGCSAVQAGTEVIYAQTVVKSLKSASDANACVALAVVNGRLDNIGSHPVGPRFKALRAYHVRGHGLTDLEFTLPKSKVDAYCHD